MQIPEQLYRDIITCMPIPCVDLMVYDQRGEVLLVKRGYTPARDYWWFPGGRILHQESRQDAVMRKLAQECGLVPAAIKELGTHDLLLERDDGLGTSHSITTVYRVIVDNPDAVQLDFQSKAARWQSDKTWLADNLHPFIRCCFNRYQPSQYD